MIEYFFNATFIILCLAIFLLYKLGTRTQNLHLKLGCVGPMPLPFIGNMASLFLYGIHEFDIQCRIKFGKIYPLYLGSLPITMVTDQELLKQILIKDFKCFTDRFDVGLKSKTTEKMLTLLKGKEWERVRNLITPTLTSGKLKKMSPLLAECVHRLINRFHNCSPNEHIDMKEFFGALTMDAIARTMFGMEVDSQTNPNNQFIVHAKKMLNISFFTPINFLVFAFPLFGRLLQKINPDWEPLGYEQMSFFSRNIQKAIAERQNSNEHYNDFLELILAASIDEKEECEREGSYLSQAEIVAQSLIFLIAGYETTATALTFATYYLAKYPEVQQELYEELVSAIGDKEELSYEALSEMPRLENAINETLRISPPVVRFNRHCTQDVDLITSDNKVIHATKGDVFAVPVYSIHTDPLIWPNPDKFDPHRFDQENKKDRSPYAFMPFGMGPRNCVGMRFALLETKWALASILKDFQLLPCKETPEKLKYQKSGFSKPVKPIILKVSKRY